MIPEKEKGECMAHSLKQDSMRDETDSLNAMSITQVNEEINRVCENLLEYAAACRYGLLRGERYVSLPMQEQDAIDFEMAVALLRQFAEEKSKLNERISSGRGKRSPIGAFRVLAEETGCEELTEALAAFEEMRNRKKKPLTEIARERAVSKLKKSSDDPKVWAAMLMESVDNGWTGIYERKPADKPKPAAQSNPMSSFDTEEFYQAALKHSMRLYGMEQE